MKNNYARIPALDGLRGLAILMVMLFHFSLNLDGHAWVENAFRSPVRDFGWTGVDLFFVLSGFLITGILVDARGAQNYFSAFYARRALRIFPLYYFSLAAIWLVFRHLVARPSGVIWYAIYAQNWLPVGGPGIGHFWSLAVEEQFYLVWPLIVYASSRRRVLQLSVAGIIFANILRVSLWEHGVETYIVYANPFTRMDALLAGAACACLARDSVWVERFRRHAAWLQVAPPLGVIGALALMKFTPRSRHTGRCFRISAILRCRLPMARCFSRPPWAGGLGFSRSSLARLCERSAGTAMPCTCGIIRS